MSALVIVAWVLSCVISAALGVLASALAAAAARGDEQHEQQLPAGADWVRELGECGHPFPDVIGRPASWCVLPYGHQTTVHRDGHGAQLFTSPDGRP